MTEKNCHNWKCIAKSYLLNSTGGRPGELKLNRRAGDPNTWKPTGLRGSTPGVGNFADGEGHHISIVTPEGHIGYYMLL